MHSASFFAMFLLTYFLASILFFNDLVDGMTFLLIDFILFLLLFISVFCLHQQLVMLTTNRSNLLLFVSVDTVSLAVLIYMIK